MVSFKLHVHSGGQLYKPLLRNTYQKVHTMKRTAAYTSKPTGCIHIVCLNINCVTNIEESFRQPITFSPLFQQYINTIPVHTSYKSWSTIISSVLSGCETTVPLLHGLRHLPAKSEDTNSLIVRDRGRWSRKRFPCRVSSSSLRSMKHRKTLYRLDAWGVATGYWSGWRCVHLYGQCLHMHTCALACFPILIQHS